MSEVLIALGGLGAIAGGGMLTTVFKEEVTGWSKTFPGLIIRSAAKTLGQPHSARFEEEWLAELEQIPGGPVTKSVWAAHIWIGRNKTAKELAESESAQRSVTIHLVPATARAVAIAPEVTVGSEAEAYVSPMEKQLLEVLRKHTVTVADAASRNRYLSEGPDVQFRTADGRIDVAFQAKWLRNGLPPTDAGAAEG
ncbi:hypothetical protein ACFYY5_25995 [Nocardia elegans]|uniref:Uncharacterized protein n=1 Tax=Nocardia elegans TaxID=300029 RepID=A0ABW6TJL3_9NOCA